ncbi:MAG: hypothetical protein ACOYX1_11395 [Acidobacteriota bacterium]
MTNFRNTLAIAAMAVLLAAPLAAQKPAPAQAALKAAIDKELIDGDLKGAIALYEKTVAEAKTDRATAAKALIRMAECHHKLGDAEARKIYERVARDYADQKEAADVARKRIGQAASADPNIVIRTVWMNSYSWGSVSPDGRYLSLADQQTGDLALHDLVAGDEKRLTNHTAGDKREFSDFSIISPDGKQVAYVWYNSSDRGFELRLIAINGNGTHRVLFKNPDVRYPGPWAWSADGKWIAVQLQRNDRTVQIALLSPTDGSYRVLKSVGWGGAGSMAFSPDGRFLAYNLPSTQDSRSGDIFVLATDGSREYPAVQYPNSKNAPVAWAPGGSHLLFLSDRTGSSGLWAVPMQDGKPHGGAQLIRADVSSVWGMSRSGALYYSVYSNDTTLMTASLDLDSGKLLSSPAPEFIDKFPGRWSPDGKFLAHGVKEAAPATFSRIRIRSLESGQARELRPQMRYINDIAWAPDGRSFSAAGADLKGRHGIFRLNAETGEVDQIALSDDGIVEDSALWRSITMQPRFGPGGNKLYYKRNFRKQGDAVVSSSRFVERDMISGTEREFAALDGLIPGLAFVPSPDGRSVAYQSRDNAGTASTINLLPIDGGEPRELLRVNAPQSLELCDWTPDGRNLIIRKMLSTANEGELWLLAATGGELHRIAIDNPRAECASIHPDGKRIVYTVRGATKREVVAMDNVLSALKKVH